MNFVSIRIGTLLVILTCVLCPARLRAQQEALTKLDSEVRAVEKVLADPLAGEEEYLEARKSLQSHIKAADNLLQDVEERDDNPAVRLHDRIVKALRTVQSRLSDSTESVALVGFALPEYDEQELLGKLATTLQSAQTALATHLHKAPDDDATTASLLKAWILAQENLAWEAGWPFTSGEADDFKANGKLTADIYLARRARGVERINEKLRSDHAFNGRESRREFSIHAPEAKQSRDDITKALTALRGEGAKVWSKGTQKFSSQVRSELLKGR
jgi:hypothetical protein